MKIDRELIADRMVDGFERLITSEWLERRMMDFLLIIWGWLLGYLYFRFQLGG